MSRQSTDTAVSSQRLLASAIGVAITAIAAPQAAHADEAGQKKTDKDRVLSLDAATIVGEQQDETTYNVDRSASKKYTAPLLDTPRSVTVVPKQVIKDTAAVFSRMHCVPFQVLPLARARAAIPPVTGHSFAASMRKAILTSMVYAILVHRPARSSTLSRSRSARALTRHSEDGARPAAASISSASRPRLGTSSMEASPMVLTRLAATPWTSTRNSSMAMRHSG